MKKCSHIIRSGPLHPSIVIGGGISTGQCQNDCFPGLAVCFDHAHKETLALLARMKIDEICKLTKERKSRV